MKNPLAPYFAETGTSPADLARKLGVAASTVGRWASGKRCPGINEAFRIQEATGGKVLVSQWRTRKKRKPRRATRVSDPVTA